MCGTTELDFCLFYLHVLTSTFYHLQPPLPLSSPPPFPPYFLPSHLPICSVLIAHCSQPSYSTSKKISSDIENTIKSIMNSCAAGTTELDFCLFYLHVLTSTFYHLQPPSTTPTSYISSSFSPPIINRNLNPRLISSHLISYYQVWGPNGVRRTACCFLSHHRCLVS